MAKRRCADMLDSFDGHSKRAQSKRVYNQKLVSRRSAIRLKSGTVAMEAQALGITAVFRVIMNIAVRLVDVLAL